MNKFYSIFLIAIFLIATDTFAKENIPNSGGKGNSGNSTLATGCSPSTAKTDLDINNVRTTIMVSADMWWDLSSAKYEVPKGSGKHSMYAGALWIGGLDAGNQLKMAAMTYRQDGNDFWGGPINQVTVDVTAATCSKYDRHWKLTRQEVQDFFNLQGTPGYTVPEPIRTWPGNGNPANNETQFLAPFKDVNNDGIYDYNAGDYPYYNIEDDTISCTSCGTTDYKDILFGHQTLWWVFNDVGNIHLETEAPAIGLEVQAQAFAFNSNNEINSMTFYKYKIINRGTTTLFDTYFGQWVDPDLGNYIDDYVGCDVGRGLGYCYNGDADDDGVSGYGLNPPAIGVDFFQGPLADANDSKDNDRDGVTDEPCEEIIMSKFVYYSNDFTITGNPENAGDFYDYLRGIWKDGTPITYGGVGYGGTIPAEFMFPGSSDPLGWGTNFVPQPPWTEASAGNLPADRRFLQSAGTFTLSPGAVNYITTGVVWAKATSGGPQASVTLIQGASDKAQALFDNCFQVISGPPAPDLVIRELDQTLILSLVNTQPTESFSKIDPAIPATYPDSLRTYRFEGYQIFQLKNADVSLEEVLRRDPDRVRLVRQVDIVNGIGQIVNWTFDQELNASVPQEMVAKEDSDEGIQHTFVITQDEFALGDKRLVNHKTYYYTVVAYAYNQYKPFNPSDPDPGQMEVYKASSDIQKYSAIPHKPVVSNFGQSFGADYGDGVNITRIEGQGNGGGALILVNPSQHNEIFNNPLHRINHPTYYGNHSTIELQRGPINVFVYDPTNVRAANFELRFLGMTDSSHWTLTNTTTNETVTSDFPWKKNYQQLFPKWGLSISIGTVIEAGNPGAVNNGFLDAAKTYEDPSRPWLGAIADTDGAAETNWIRSGTTTTPLDYSGLDDQQVYEGILGGTWGPYRLLSKDPPAGPKWAQTVDTQNPLDKTVSVEVVFTSDKSKWTRSCVIEMQNNISRFGLRTASSVDKDGNPDNTGTTGKGWFPGYAINLENGERLNIMFGENSFYMDANGGDMQWNPVSTVYDSQSGEPIFGGMHYVYIMSTLYDSCDYYHSQLLAGTPPGKRNTYRDALWTTLPLLNPGEQLLSNEVRVRIDVAENYKAYTVNGENNGNPMYSFSTTGLEANQNNVELAKTALDEIRVVPNPYYAYSQYEKNQLDNRVKITNLPPVCTVTIYTVNGTLIRRYNRSLPNSDTSFGEPVGQENEDTSLDWDLRNTVGVPIASGIYIIHVNAPGVGEKTVKFFGVMRPIDLDTF